MISEKLPLYQSSNYKEKVYLCGSLDKPSWSHTPKNHCVLTVVLICDFSQKNEKERNFLHPSVKKNIVKVLSESQLENVL